MFCILDIGLCMLDIYYWLYVWIVLFHCLIFLSFHCVRLFIHFNSFFSIIIWFYFISFSFHLSVIQSMCDCNWVLSLSSSSASLFLYVQKLSFTPPFFSINSFLSCRKSAHIDPYWFWRLIRPYRKYCMIIL